MEIEPVTIGFAALVGVMALIMLRVPIAVSLITVSAVGIMAIVGAESAVSMLSNIPYSFASSWTLSSVPMLLLMGYVAFHTGMTLRLAGSPFPKCTA